MYKEIGEKIDTAIHTIKNLNSVIDKNIEKLTIKGEKEYNNYKYSHLQGKYKPIEHRLIGLNDCINNMKEYIKLLDYKIQYYNALEISTSNKIILLLENINGEEVRYISNIKSNIIKKIIDSYLLNENISIKEFYFDFNICNYNLIDVHFIQNQNSFNILGVSINKHFDNKFDKKYINKTHITTYLIN